MSCPKIETCINKTCEQQFIGKQCKCVNIKGDNCQPIKTTCAYEESGVLYGCSAGCCNNQCDGQCSSVSGAPNIVVGTAAATQLDILNMYTVSIAIILIALILISTVSLF